MEQKIIDFYMNYSKEPLKDRIILASVTYRKLEEAFKKVMGSWEAFNATIDTTIMFLCCDGNLTRNDYELFKQISKKNPTYDELYQNAIAVSKNYNNIITVCRRYGIDLLSSVAYFASVIFACKESYGPEESRIVNALLSSFK